MMTYNIIICMYHIYTPPCGSKRYSPARGLASRASYNAMRHTSFDTVAIFVAFCFALNRGTAVTSGGNIVNRRTKYCW